jgi:hypothetical protein
MLWNHYYLVTSREVAEAYWEIRPLDQRKDGRQDRPEYHGQSKRQPESLDERIDQSQRAEIQQEDHGSRYNDDKLLSKVCGGARSVR